MEKVILSTTETVVIETDTSGTVVSGQLISTGGGAAGISSVTYAVDTDVTELTNGSVLVFNSTTAMWKATKLLQEQTIECGQF